VPAARVQLKDGDAAPIVLDTDENGQAVFLELRPAKYHLSLAQKGFDRASAMSTADFQKNQQDLAWQIFRQMRGPPPGRLRASTIRPR